MVKKKQIITGIDVGTTKICSVIAEVDADRIHLLGVGVAPSRGLKKGIVVNLSETIESVKASLELAENQSQVMVESAYVSVGGAYIRGINTTGETAVRGKNGGISNDDIDRAILAARDLEVPNNYEVIHVLTQTFNVDGQDGVVNPLGMFGHQLEVKLHLVLNASAIVQNIVNAINKAGVIVDSVVMQQLASSEAILSDDEKEMGTIVVDIGGGTTDFAVYGLGSIWHSEVLPLGGNLITKDIAIGLKAPIQEAEELKKEVGSVFPESVPAEEVIEVNEVGTGRRKTVPRRLLCQIVQARCDEILAAVARLTQRLGVNKQLMTGVVFTGGGALLDGLTDRAEQILQMPVRVGYPINVVPHDHEYFLPPYCTALGLLKYGEEIQQTGAHSGSRTVISSRPRATTEKMKNWLLEKIG